MDPATLNAPPPPFKSVAPVAATPQPKRNATLKLLVIVGLIVLLQIPLFFVDGLREDREKHHGGSDTTLVARKDAPVFDTYRMVERAVKYSVLVTALVFTAFFLFEVLAGLRLHVVHYALVGAALCLFYLALLALGEVIDPGMAYLAAALASSGLIVFYSAAVLRAWARASVIAGLLAVVHGVLYIVLRMEDYALLAGTGTLFVALGVVMYFTRNIDWDTHVDAAPGGTP